MTQSLLGTDDDGQKLILLRRSNMGTRWHTQTGKVNRNSVLLCVHFALYIPLWFFRCLKAAVCLALLLGFIVNAVLFGRGITLMPKFRMGCLKKSLYF